jgi:beta-lactamase superfamily II metal-dependent hydrolase
MRTLFRVSLLPANHGDCILLEYGDPEAPRRILIDGGTTGTWQRLRSFLGLGPGQQQKLDLLVITHVDDDHIAGILPMLASGALDFDDIWFNAYRHLEENDLEDQGPLQGEKLTTNLWPRFERWNKAVHGAALCVPEVGQLPVIPLADGMKITLLSPTRDKLRKMVPVWDAVCKKEGLDPQVARPPHPPGLEVMGGRRTPKIDVDTLITVPFDEDTREANGSSIAFLAEYDGRRVLFGADAHPSVLAAAIARLDGDFAVDAFKIPHHGSKNNLSTELLGLIATKRYLVSTNGAHHEHPHLETIARIVHRRVSGCELHFNYRTPFNDVWAASALQAKWGYVAKYPAASDEPCVLDL